MCPFQFQSICLNLIIVVIIKESFQCLEVGFHHSCPILLRVSVITYMYHGVTWDEIILSILTFTIIVIGGSSFHALCMEMLEHITLNRTLQPGT